MGPKAVTGEIRTQAFPWICSFFTFPTLEKRLSLSLIHILFVDGQSVHLTQSEYKIVSMLGLYSGRVLTYDYVLRELWGMSTKENRQILRVNMANIRRKLEKNPAEPQYIFTEIGVGYWMREED